MSIEIILFGVVALVLVLDFALKGVKKKNIQEDVERIGEENIERNLIILNYFLSRKRNVLSFIIFTILLKPVSTYLISPNYFEQIDYNKKIERESFLDDKINLLNTYPTTRIGMPGLPNTTGIFLENYPKNSSRWNGLNGHDSLLLYKKYFIKKYTGEIGIWDNIEITKRHDLDPELFGQIKKAENHEVKGSKYSGSYLRGSSERIFYYGTTDTTELIEKLNRFETIFYYGDSGSIIDVKVKLLEFEKIPSIDEMIKCCNIYYDFKKDNYFDKEGNQLLHIPVVYGNQMLPNKFYFYPKIKKVDSFRNHFKGAFETKPEFFGVSFLLVGVFVLLFNDKIKAR